MPLTPGRAPARTGAAVAIGALVSSALLAAPAQAAERVLDETDVNQAYTRAAGSNAFLEDGVRVETIGTTSQSKAAGYFDVDRTLASVGEPSMRYRAESGTTAPGLQLVVDLDGNGTADGTLVGEPAAYGNNWWLPGRTLGGQDVDPALRALAPKVGGGGSADNGPLADWRTAFPQAQVVQAGWSLGSGVEGRGVISRITVADDYYFSAADVETVTLRRGDVVQRDTRAQGRNTFRPTGGVRIFTFGEGGSPDQRKAAGYFDVREPLATVGEPTWDHQADEGIQPGKQLIVDLDGNLATVNDRGILVGEPAYGKNWWLTNGSSAAWKAIDPSGPDNNSGNGSAFFGTLNEWRLAAPGALVVEAGWSLGSGVLGDGILTSFRVGQSEYRFAGNRVPVAEDVSASTTVTEAVDLEPQFSDPDTQFYISPNGGAGVPDTLTVTVGDVTGGTAELTEDGTIRFQPDDEFFGDATISYTVTDDRGLSDTATATVVVTNTPPVAADVTATVRANGADPKRSVDVPLGGSDADGDTLVYEVGTSDDGTVTLSGSTATFTPADGFVGETTFGYTVADGRGAFDDGTVTVTVTNAAPVAQDGTGQVLARSSATVARSVDVALRATDGDDDALTYTVGAVTGGTAVLTEDGGAIRFTPEPRFSGNATVAFTVSDGVESDTGSVVVNVRKGTATIAATSRTLPSRNTYVTGTVTSQAGTNPSASTGEPVIITRGGVEIGRGRVIDGKIVDRINRGTRPGILIGEFRRGASFGVTLVYPGTTTVAPRTQRVQVNIPR